MSFFLEEEVEVDFDFDYRQIAEKVINGIIMSFLFSEVTRR